MSDRPDSVAKLIPAVVRGDAEALDRWYRAEHAEAFRLCFGFLADRTEAEDVAQDAMLHLLDRLDRYDPRREYDPWRTSVVLNLCRDRLRRTRARQRAERSAAERVSTGDEPATDAPRRFTSRPDREAERGELQELLAGCLVQLTPREREVFVLRDLSQLPTERVAELLDIGASSVRSLLALARRRVRGILGPQLAEPESGSGEVPGA
jgi:RNA polymerase sigma-70 factor (ECF subfamily)